MIDYNRFIQVAGVIDQKEAETIIRAGVKFLGFPLRLPVHKEDLSEEEAAQIIAHLPDDVHGVLITYLDKAEDIKGLMNKLNCKIVQLHGDIRKEEIIRLKNELPGISVIKSLVVSENNFDKLKGLVDNLADICDAFITDTYDPLTGASGATGKTHDWNISAELVRLSPKPVILAGGINADNVKEAIISVKPAGVDVHTGVEKPDGRKDFNLMKLFVDRANEGFDLIN